MGGDSAAGRRGLCNNFVTSSRSPEVVNSHPTRLEKSGELRKDGHSTLMMHPNGK